MKLLMESWRKFLKEVEILDTPSADPRSQELSKLAKETPRISADAIRQIVAIVDPTGVLSWPDVIRAKDDLVQDPTIMKAGIFGLELLGIIPVLGKLAKGPAATMKLAKVADNVGEIATIARASGDIATARKLEKAHAATTGTRAIKNLVQLDAPTLKNIFKGQPLGTGGGNSAWAIPGHADLVVRAPTKTSMIGGPWYKHLDSYLDQHTLEAATDASGQLVGRVGPEITVLKRQSGTPGYEPPRRHWGGGPKLLSKMRAALKADLLRKASLPQSAYDDLVAQAIDYGRKGVGIDPSKANNVLIDTRRARFNFVDLDSHSGPLSARNLATMLASPHHFYRVELMNDPIALRAFKAIENKLLSAVKRNPGQPGKPVELSWAYKPKPKPVAQPIATEVW